jgi:hypothetical protein
VDWKAIGSDGDQDGHEAIESLISLLRQACEDFAGIVHRGEHDGYRVAALRGLVDTAMTCWQVQWAAGLVPHHPGAPKLQAQMQMVMREFAELFRRQEISDDVLREFLEFAERGMQQPARERFSQTADVAAIDGP